MKYLKTLCIIAIAVLMQVMPAYSQLPGYIPKDGLVAYLPLNGNTDDASGKGSLFENTAVDFDTVTLSGGVKKIFGVFNGTDETASYLLAKDATRFMTEQYSYTIQMQLKQLRPAGASKTYQGVVCLGAQNWTWGPAYNLYLSGLDNTIVVSSHWNQDPSLSGEVVSTDNTAKPNEWIRVVVVYDGVQQKMFIDGKLIGKSNSGISYSHHDRFIIGANADNPDGRIMAGFNGNLDDFAFWNRALADDEISTIFNQNTSGSCRTYRQIASVTLDTKQETTWTSPALKQGVPYRIKGQGVFTPFVGTLSVDCEYEFYDPCTLHQRANWVRLGRDLDSAFNTDTKLKPVEKTINCDAHTYTYEVIGDGRPLYVLFRDNRYDDNIGSLTIEITECADYCDLGISSDSILGYRNVETHQVVTYALRSNPALSYKWIATGGYMLGASTNHFCDVIWGYDKNGSVCCIVSDSTCSDTICVTTTINNKTTGGIAGGDVDVPTMSVKPNPAADMIDISTALGDKQAHFELVDVTGVVVQRVQGIYARMSVSDFAPGVYHIVQRDALGNVLGMERVVIKR
jgi:hypothetical protein